MLESATARHRLALAKAGVWLLSAIALGVASTIGLPATAKEPAQRSAMLEGVGRDLFVRHCSVCHGSDGRGAGPAAPALKVLPADLTAIRQRRGGEFPRAELARIIDGRHLIVSHGTREMPIWGKRFSGELADPSMGDEWARGHISVLVDYLFTLQR